jgi:hypothetical protein
MVVAIPKTLYDKKDFASSNLLSLSLPGVSIVWLIPNQYDDTSVIVPRFSNEECKVMLSSSQILECCSNDVPSLLKCIPMSSGTLLFIGGQDMSHLQVRHTASAVVSWKSALPLNKRFSDAVILTEEPLSCCLLVKIAQEKAAAEKGKCLIA